MAWEPILTTKPTPKTTAGWQPILSVGSSPQPINSVPSVFPSLSTATQTSTPATSNLSTVGFAKNFFMGPDNTAGAITRNTVIGIPKAGLQTAAAIGKGLFDSVVSPNQVEKDTEQQFNNFTNQALPSVVATPVAKVLSLASRVLAPALQPLAQNIAEITEINRPGGIADQIAANKLPPSALDEFAVLQKTAPQIVGDVAQAVLSAYSGSEVPGLLGEGANLTTRQAVTKGFTHALPIGELFGGAQALSSGSKNPLEIAGTIGTSGFAGGVLGAITSGAIPVSKEVFNKVVEAKKVYDGMSPAQKQAGFAKNPLGKDSNGLPQQPQQAEEGQISSPKDKLGQEPAQASQGLPQQGMQPRLGQAPQVPGESLKRISYTKDVPQDFNSDKYVQEQIAKREEARTGAKASIFNKTKSFLADVKAKLVDFSAPIEDTLYSSVKKNKLTLKPEEDIHNQIDRVLRSPTLAGQFAKDNGIADVIRKVDNPDALDQYLIAKHAVELDTRGIETGRNIEKDQALVQALAPKYEQFASTISQYSQKLLDYSVESSLISKSLADTLKARYPDYVPFQRVFDEIEKTQAQGNGRSVASLSKQSVVQKIEGSSREIESPIESLLTKTNDAFKQGEKNKAGKLLAGYKSLPGNPFSLKELKPGEHAPHTVSYLDNGVKRTFSTTQEIANAAKALNVQQLNILGRILALPVRVARVGITGINLPFIGANIAKDAISAFINSDHGLKTSIANPENFVRSLFSAVGHDKLYEEMVRAGGAGTSFDISRNQVEQTVGHIRAGRNIGSKILYTVRHPGELLRAVEDTVGRGEEFTRIQQYRGTKQAELSKGSSELSAQTAGARQAREATVNFARRGEWGTVLNSALLYLNASIQGTRTLLRNLQDKPVQTSIKIAVSALAPMAIATAWNLNDPKRKEAYQDIPEYEKENNIIIVPDNPTQDSQGKWNVIKIPLSQEINNLVSMARRPIEAAQGLDPLGFGDVAKSLLGTVSPINPSKGSVLSAITPQAIKPTIEAAANTNLFTGIPQVSQGLERLPVEAQVKPYTSGTARKIGGLLHVSPILAENFIKSTFGGVGSQALNAVDQSLARFGVIPKDEIGGQNVLSAITARFGKAAGGAVAEKQYQIEDAASQQKALERAQFKTSTYDPIQSLVAQGKSNEAQKMVDSMTEEDYKTYKDMRAGERSKVTTQLRQLLSRSPKQAVAFVRSQPPDEQQRLLGVMTDEEYKLYEQGK